MVTSVAFSPDGNTLASASWDDSTGVRLWDVCDRTPNSDTLTRTWTGTGSERSHSVRMATHSLVPGWDIPSCGLWDVHTGTISQTDTHRTHGASVYSVAFSPDGNTLASSDGVVARSVQCVYGM